MIQKNYKENFYFQFKDIFRLVNVSDSTITSVEIKNPYDIRNDYSKQSATYTYKGFLGNVLLYSKDNSSFANTTLTNLENESAIVYKLLSLYILPNAWEKYIVRSSRSDTPYHTAFNQILDVNEDVERFFYESMAFINDTYPYYSKIIGLYESKQDNLLNQLGTHDITKFNDMPQTTNVSTDDHLTNITDYQHEDNMIPIIERLREIEDNLKKYYQEWADLYLERFIFTLGD